MTAPAPENKQTSAGAHAAHADQLRKILHEQYGVDAELIAPTRDNRGHVRLNFAQLEKIMYEPED